jgi:hypothetical protein
VTGRRERRPDLASLSRAAFGGTLAVALVVGGIVALQAVVPAPDAGQGPVVSAPTTFPLDVPTTPPTKAAPTTAPPPVPVVPPSPVTAPPSPAARPSLTVLNNSRVNGLASRAARDFAAGGWHVAATGNLRGRTPRTTVYYAPGYADEAAALRRQFPKILDARPRPEGLPGNGPLTVVVTRDYAA